MPDTDRIPDHRQPAAPGSPLWEQRRQDLIAEHLHHIEEGCGWALTGVFGIEHLHGTTAYVFTIGNYLVGLPELLVAASDSEFAGTWLNKVTEQMRAGTIAPLAHGVSILQDPGGNSESEMRVVQVADDETWRSDLLNQWWGVTGMARRPLWVLQLVWPGYHAVSEIAAGLEGDELYDAIETAGIGLTWPTKDDPWVDQPIYGEVWW